MANCGACGTACVPNEACTGGACQCPAPFTACAVTGGRACADLRSDAAHCGACGRACPTGQTCVSGSCACPSGQTLCNGACVNIQTDASNCGACGTVCQAGQPCSGGRCGLFCNGTVCNGGTACCAGGACPFAHPNGMGQLYFDCSPLGNPAVAGSYTQAMAVEAARAWAPAGTPSATEVSGCVSIRAPDTSCTLWCWQGGLQGKASTTTLGGSCAVPPVEGTSGFFIWR